jgi:hypothetical protein
VACDGDGIGLQLVAARANDHDSPLLEPTLAGICDMVGPLLERPCLHLDRGYDSRKSRDLLDILGCHGEIAVKGVRRRSRTATRRPDRMAGCSSARRRRRRAEARSTGSGRRH